MIDFRNAIICAFVYIIVFNYLNIFYNLNVFLYATKIKSHSHFHQIILPDRKRYYTTRNYLTQSSRYYLLIRAICTYDMSKIVSRFIIYFKRLILRRDQLLYQMNRKGIITYDTIDTQFFYVHTKFYEYHTQN